MTFLYEKKYISDKMHGLSDEMRELETFFRARCLID